MQQLRELADDLFEVRELEHLGKRYGVRKDPFADSLWEGLFSIAIQRKPN